MPFRMCMYVCAHGAHGSSLSTGAAPSSILLRRRTAEWARRRYQMGLPGFGMPWEESEESWLLRRPGPPDLEDLTKTSDGGLPEHGEDLPAEMLADEDSKFVQLDGIKVHYKEVHPPVGMVHADGSGGGETAVVLVHGFGGGAFSWRHVMEPLAMQCQCRVVAFDRPAFGECPCCGLPPILFMSIHCKQACLCATRAVANIQKNNTHKCLTALKPRQRFEVWHAPCTTPAFGRAASDLTRCVPLLQA